MLRRPGGLGSRGMSHRSRGLAASHLQVNTYPAVTGLGVAVDCFITHKRGWSHFLNLVHMWIYNPTVYCCQNDRRLEVRNWLSSTPVIRTQGISGKFFHLSKPQFSHWALLDFQKLYRTAGNIYRVECGKVVELCTEGRSDTHFPGGSDQTKHLILWASLTSSPPTEKIMIQLRSLVQADTWKVISVTCWSLYFSGDRLIAFLIVISVLQKVCPVPVSMSLRSLSSISCYGVKYQYDGAETSTSHLWHSADSDTTDRYALLFSSHFPELNTHTHTHTKKDFPGSPVVMTSHFHCMPHSAAKNKQNNNKNKPSPSFYWFLFFQLIVNVYFQPLFFWALNKVGLGNEKLAPPSPVKTIFVSRSSIPYFHLLRWALSQGREAGLVPQQHLVALPALALANEELPLNSTCPADAWKCFSEVPACLQPPEAWPSVLLKETSQCFGEGQNFWPPFYALGHSWWDGRILPTEMSAS